MDILKFCSNIGQSDFFKLLRRKKNELKLHIRREFFLCIHLLQANVHIKNV